MAAATTNLLKTGIFWMNDDEEQPLGFVPDLNQGAFVSGPHSSNKRGTRAEQAAVKRQRERATPRQRPRGSGAQKPRQRECSGGSSSENVPLSAPEDQPSGGPSTFLSLSQMEKERSQISLKDLCPEDKKRIANLIQELARVSEEKEESVQRFMDEQGQFEQKILELEEQNLIIAQERASLQQQYRECQELLGLYQLHLREQQHRLDSQVRADEASRSSSYTCAAHANQANVANGSVCDGSYLSLAPPHGHQMHYRPTTHHAPVPQPQPQQLQPNHHHPTTMHQPVDQYLHPTAAPSPQQVHAPAPPSAPRPRAGHVTSEAIVPVSCGVGQCHRPKHQHLPCSCPQCGQEQDPRPDQGPGGYETQPLNKTCNKHQRSTEDSSSPGLGSQDWDQRKNQLLMQKIQLEQERERLQRRLSEQEERRSREEERRKEEEKRSRKETPQTNGRLRHTEEKKQTEVYVPEHSTEETSSRRDMGTSPGPSSAHPEPRPLASPQTRLDLSLSELLEIFSPVCPSSKQRSATRRPKAALLPPRSCGPAPFRSHASLTSDPDLELEESRILEDIFFIL